MIVYCSNMKSCETIAFGNIQNIPRFCQQLFHSSVIKRMCLKIDVKICVLAFAVTGTNFTSHLTQLKPHGLLQRQRGHARNLFVGVFPKFLSFSRFGYPLGQSFSFYFPVFEYHIKYSLCDCYFLLLSA